MMRPPLSATAASESGPGNWPAVTTVPVVGLIESTRQASVIAFGWAGFVLFAGIVVMFVRRK